MDKIKSFVKKNYKVAISFILGMIVCIGIGVSAVATKDVVYDNSKSGLTSTNLQGAIDELNTKATTKINEAEAKCPDGYICTKIIVAAYTYNSSTCVTGEESACVQTSCYENKTSGSCPSGTIIKYKVNDSTTKYFHVLHDDGETMTLQQRENTVYNTAWYSEDYDASKGPTTLLPALESATSDWTNVNDQTYTMGTTVFKTNKFTGCSSYSSCTSNTYTLNQRTAKARMITLQEASALGCTENSKSCPNFMNNYLYHSTSYGGTVSDTNGDDNYAYWTMSANSSYSDRAWRVRYNGSVYYDYITNSNSGARAVVVVSK